MQSVINTVFTLLYPVERWNKMIRKSLVRQSSYAFSKYPFLARLGLKETDNLGCWNGKEWLGNGETHTAMNPSTGEAIATVKFGSVQDLESCIRNMDEAEGRVELFCVTSPSFYSWN